MQTNGQLALDMEEQLVKHPLTAAELMNFIKLVPKGKTAWRVVYESKYRLVNPEVEHDGHVITRATGKLIVQKDGVGVEMTDAPTAVVVRGVYNAVHRRHERRAKAARR